MGVPKFFRWMSERYPAISQLIADNRIPEFDCLYLDMNGIIHNCTHKDSDDAMFRMTEEQMFIAIFNYIEHLFGKIKPKQLFFMAIDGVAPRAKMNQQRARRFRTALDAETARDKAIQEGKEMPKEEAFDSLLSHDPHFCLLREEVTFGRQSKAKSKELEHQNFYLMHLCIVREYLELEFQELKEPGLLSSPFDLERVIDDFILMAFFVGNDFLPNLPNLHINEGALALMFKVYKTVLPKAGGFINEGGVINMARLAMLLDELSHVEYRFFESENSDKSWFKAKQMAKEDIMVKGKAKGKVTMTTPQREIWKQVKTYVTSRSTQPLELSSALPAADRKFVQELAESLHLEWKTVEDEQVDRHMQLSFPAKPDGDEDEDEDEESQLAILRVVKQYDTAKVVDVSKADAQAEMDRQYEVKFQEWKDTYYKGKFEWDRKNEIELTKLCENYVQGLQWVLHYYYRDVIKGLNADVNFKLGQPFHPYEQLMGVLPDRSKNIVPAVYHDLMTNPASPIIDFYPRDFELDMNGKKMEWEAVVKIPFIDEKRLLAAMAPKNLLLSEDEKFRNEFGVTVKFSHDPEVDFTYPSSLVGIFPDISHCRCVENIFDLPTIEGLDYHVGLMKGVKLGDAALAGFPSLATLPYNATLGFHGVNVFQQDSRNESMVVTIQKTEERTNVKLASMKLGKRVFVGYPFLNEGKVVKVSDELFDYFPSEDASSHAVQKPHGPREIDDFRKKAERIEETYSKRLGIIIGPVESITHVEMLKGLKKTDEGATIKEYGTIPGLETDFASQVVVDEVISEDQRFIERAALSIEEEFPTGSRAFFLGEFNYGRPAEVIGHQDDKADIWLSVTKGKEHDFGKQVINSQHTQSTYTPSFAVAKMLGLNGLVLSKIMSSFSVSALGLPRLNLGLNLKFEAKKLKVLGYSRKNDKGWEFSNKAIELLSSYMTKFPEFFAGIQRNPHANEYEDTDFYPKEIAGTKIKEIVAFLKSIESKNFEKVPLDAEQLDSDAVMAIEQASDHALANGPGVEAKRMKGVPRNALMKPSDAEQRLGNQKFALGDRVVYVQDSGRVPIGGRGVVVGISRTPRTVLLDVLFDVTFMSGTTLGERCSPFRGSTVPAASVLNLSNKQVIAGSKAAADRRPVSTSTPLVVNGGYGAPAGPGGRGQLREASVPGPLKGSFRGAVAGQQNGFQRGNGSASRGRARGNFSNDSRNDPYMASIAMRGGPSNSGGRGGRGGTVNGNGFRGGRGGASPAQSYNAVPPPAGIDARGRGGGRGRGARGRAGASRGRSGPSVARA
ncbi:exonuclease II Exo2 [Diplocarpon rosae]|nr:exonuclease II Exo2 [Diplocarpon rosae]